MHTCRRAAGAQRPAATPVHERRGGGSAGGGTLPAASQAGPQPEAEQRLAASAAAGRQPERRQMVETCSCRGRCSCCAQQAAAAWRHAGRWAACRMCSVTPQETCSCSSSLSCCAPPAAAAGGAAGGVRAAAQSAAGRVLPQQAVHLLRRVLLRPVGAAGQHHHPEAVHILVGAAQQLRGERQRAEGHVKQRSKGEPQQTSVRRSRMCWWGWGWCVCAWVGVGGCVCVGWWWGGGGGGGGAPGRCGRRRGRVWWVDGWVDGRREGTGGGWVDG